MANINQCNVYLCSCRPCSRFDFACLAMQWYWAQAHSLLYMLSAVSAFNSIKNKRVRMCACVFRSHARFHLLGGCAHTADVLLFSFLFFFLADCQSETRILEQCTIKQRPRCDSICNVHAMQTSVAAISSDKQQQKNIQRHSMMPRIVLIFLF